MIRNSSHKENEHFKDKLEELDYDYQYGDWKKLESKLDKKLKVSRIKKLSIAAAIIVASTITVWNIDSNQVNKTSDSTPLIEKQDKRITEKLKPSKSIDPTIELKESNKETELEKTMSDSKELITNNSEEQLDKNLELNIVEGKPDKNTDSSIDLEINEKNETDAVVTSVISIDSIQIIGKKCLGNEIKLIAHLNEETNSSNSFNWSINGENFYSTTNKLTFDLDKVGSYKIYVSLNSNKEYASVFFTTNQAESIDFTYEDSDDPFNDLKVIFKSTGGQIKHHWTIDGESIIENKATTEYIFSKEGLYDVTLNASLKNGCQVEIYKPISVSINFDPLAPNAFTPDGDGLNDKFIPVGFLNRDDNFIMEIFDMEGQMVYRTTDNQQAWDGSFNNTGSTLNNGIYLWKVVISNKLNQSKSFSGSVRIRNSDK